MVPSPDACIKPGRLDGRAGTRYAPAMFAMKACSVEGCPLPAFWDRRTCAGHDPDPAALARAVAAHLAASGEHRGLSLSGLTLGDLDLSHRRLEFCDFSRSAFERVNLAGSTLRFAYFDFSTLKGCDFRGTDIDMCVFAGAEIDSCDFSGSEIMHASFLGAQCSAVRFDDSDLYSSRFTGARFRDVDMRNCNLKEVHFDSLGEGASIEDAARLLGEHGLNVRSSNAREAVYGGER
jgi:uncharacterized protein YjbI with pentapeptide repeats